VTILLDGNLLVALSVPEHVHSGPADNWFAGLQDSFATCPITQGTLIRFLLRNGKTAEEALSVLAGFTKLPDHVFWPDDIQYEEVRPAGVIGHRQVTDAYLAQLARYQGGRLATFDKGLAALHSDVAELIPALP
jgi:toxin-antitoxin system PIN domain toxin